jgi:hypothetical protein
VPLWQPRLHRHNLPPPGPGHPATWDVVAATIGATCKETVVLRGRGIGRARGPGPQHVYRTIRPSHRAG